MVNQELLQSLLSGNIIPFLESYRSASSLNRPEDGSFKNSDSDPGDGRQFVVGAINSDEIDISHLSFSDATLYKLCRFSLLNRDVISAEDDEKPPYLDGLDDHTFYSDDLQKQRHPNVNRLLVNADIRKSETDSGFYIGYPSATFVDFFTLLWRKWSDEAVNNKQSFMGGCIPNTFLVVNYLNTNPERRTYDYHSDKPKEYIFPNQNLLYVSHLQENHRHRYEYSSDTKRGGFESEVEYHPAVKPPTSYSREHSDAGELLVFGDYSKHPTKDDFYTVSAIQTLNQPEVISKFTLSNLLIYRRHSAVLNRTAYIYNIRFEKVNSHKKDEHGNSIFQVKMFGDISIPDNDLYQHSVEIFRVLLSFSKSKSYTITHINEVLKVSELVFSNMSSIKNLTTSVDVVMLDDTSKFEAISSKQLTDVTRLFLEKHLSVGHLLSTFNDENKDVESLLYGVPDETYQKGIVFV